MLLTISVMEFQNWYFELKKQTLVQKRIISSYELQPGEVWSRNVDRST